MGKEHYFIKYSSDGNILAMFCNYCNFGVSAFGSARTKSGHHWPFMVHKIKKHLRDEHNINLYKRNKNREEAQWLQ